MIAPTPDLSRRTFARSILAAGLVGGIGLALLREYLDNTVKTPDDIETLEDLVLAAVNDATESARKLTEAKMGPLTAGLGGGLGLPGL